MKHNLEKTLGTKIAFISMMILCLSSLISSPVALAAGFLFTWLIGQPFAQFSRKLVRKCFKTIHSLFSMILIIAKCTKFTEL